MDDEHANERVRGKDVLFNVKLVRLQERLLPEWDELPMLEEVEGTLDELREKTRAELAESMRNAAERETLDNYIKQLVEQTEYDIPDALIEQESDHMLHQQEREFERYGITLDQMLQYRGQTHDQAVEELKPQAEDRLKTTLALREIVRAERLSIDEAEIDDEVARMVETYEEEQRERARVLLSNQLRSTVASSVLDKKLRDRLVAIATGEAPALVDGTEEASVSVEASAEEARPEGAELSAEAPTLEARAARADEGAEMLADEEPQAAAASDAQ
jgi:trigger factor